MPFAAPERVRRWVDAASAAAPLVRFRVAFGGIWLLYDALDLAGSGTARIHDWLEASAPPGLVALQVALVACELAMVLGRPGRHLWVVMLAATALRAIEWGTYLELNDFAYYVVTALILAHVGSCSGQGWIPSPEARGPRWPRDVLLMEAAWIYFASALMKVNPTWLSGRHLFVRLQYLRAALGWPYPDVVNRCADALTCDAALAWLAVLGELTLAVLLAFRPRRQLVAPLAILIHGFGALATNVWFFGPSLIAQVTLLTSVTGEFTRAGAPRSRSEPARR